MTSAVTGERVFSYWPKKTLFSGCEVCLPGLCPGQNESIRKPGFKTRGKVGIFISDSAMKSMKCILIGFLIGYWQRRTMWMTISFLFVDNVTYSWKNTSSYVITMLMICLYGIEW